MLWPHVARIQKIVRVFLAGELLTFARNRHGSLVLEPLGVGLSLMHKCYS